MSSVSCFNKEFHYLLNVKKCLFIVFLYLLPLLTYAQEQTDILGSERTERSESKDQPGDYLRDLIKLAEAQLSIGEYADAEELALEANALALRQNDTSGTIRARKTLARIQWRSNKYPEATNYFLQATSIMEEVGAERDLSETYEEMGDMYREWNLTDKALEYYLKSKVIYDNLDDINGKIATLEKIGACYQLLDEYNNAAKQYQQLLNLYNKTNNQEKIIDAYEEISDIYALQGNISSAQFYNLRILDLYKQLNDSTGATRYLVKVALNFKKNENYQDALEHFIEALHYNEDLLNKGKPAVNHGTLLMYIGIMYQYLGEYQSSSQYYTKSMAEEASDDEGKERRAERSVLLNEMAYSQMKTGDRKAAKNTAERSLEYAIESGDIQIQSDTYKTISDIYRDLGIFKKALEYYKKHSVLKDSLYSARIALREETSKNKDKVETIEQEMKNLLVERKENEGELAKLAIQAESQRKDIALLKSEKENKELLLRQKQIEQANELARQKQAYELREKDRENKILETQKNVQELRSMTSDLRAKETEQKNEVLRQEQEIKTLELERAKSLRLFFIGLFIILAILIFLILRSYHLKRKANTILAQQNVEIQEQKDKIEQSYHNVKVLSDIAKEITSELSFANIIKAAYRNLQTFMDVTEFGVGIYNKKTNRIEFPHAISREHELSRLYYSIEDKNRLAVRCFTEGEEIMIGNYQDEYTEHVGEQAPSKTGEDAISIMYMPLQVKSRIIGVITVQSFEENAYTEYHRYILANLAIHIAIALENANTYQEIADKTDKLEKAFSELKSAQAKLVQSEKMASLGLLTAGVAHEINNPINFVYAGVDGLKVSLESLLEVLERYEKMDAVEDVQALLAHIEDVQHLKEEIFFEETKASLFELVGAIREGARRTAEIVNGLRNFSRLDETELKNADIHKGIDNTLLLLNNKIKRQGIAVKKDYTPNLQKIICYPGQLNQVFMNILSNAMDAIKHDKGEICIATQRRDDDLYIRIRDNGEGMPSEVRDRIFEPFYTTKDMGQGTGLGLSISFGIIEKHQGQIEVHSEPGKGTEFCIILPVKVNELAQVI